MNRENEHRPDVAEQAKMQQSPEDAKSKFHQMVEQAKQQKPHKSMAEVRIEQAPGEPGTTRELKKQAQMFREQSQGENFSPEQRQSTAAAAEHYQSVADTNEEMVNLRLSQLSPEEQQSWTEEYDRINRTIDAYQQEINKPGQFEKASEMLDIYKKKQEEWEARLPKL